jgi:hypothetical protein
MNRLLVATPYGPSAPVVAVLVAPPELLHKASRVRVVPIGDRTIDNGCCLLVARREVARDVVPLVRAGRFPGLKPSGDVAFSFQARSSGPIPGKAFVFVPLLPASRAPSIWFVFVLH